MALKAFVDSLDSVDEAHRPLYVARDDGTAGFRINAEGVEDVSGLRATLSKYKEKLKGLSDDQLAELRAIDVVEYKRLKEAAAKGGKGNKGDDGDPDVEKIVTKRVAEAVAEFAPLKEEVETLRAENRELKIGSVIERAALAAGVDPAVLKDVRKITDGNFSVNKAGKVVVLDEDGDETAMNPEKFFSDTFKKKRPHYYKPTGSSGGGGGGGDGGLKLTAEQMSSLSPQERLRMARRESAAKKAS